MLAEHACGEWTERADFCTNNPNLNPANATGGLNPFGLDRSQAATSDQNHNYGPEQTALHGGLVDLYPSSVGVLAGADRRLPGFTPLGNYGHQYGLLRWQYRHGLLELRSEVRDER